MKKYQKTIKEKLEQYKSMEFESLEHAEEWLGKAFDRVAREAIDQEDHIADVGKKVDEVPDEIEELGYIIADLNKPTTEFRYGNKINELIKAVNYLLKKQR